MCQNYSIHMFLVTLMIEQVFRCNDNLRHMFPLATQATCVVTRAYFETHHGDRQACECNHGSTEMRSSARLLRYAVG